MKRLVSLQQQIDSVAVLLAADDQHNKLAYFLMDSYRDSLRREINFLRAGERFSRCAEHDDRILPVLEQVSLLLCDKPLVDDLRKADECIRVHLNSCASLTQVY